MLFFDLDGTLLDSNGIWLEIDIEFLGRHGIAPVPEDYTDYVAHHGAEESAAYTRRRFGLTESEGEILQAWKDMAREAYASRLPLKPGAGEFLARCRQAGYSMALLTSCMPQLCRAALAHHGLEGLFTQVVTTQELGLEMSQKALDEHFDLHKAYIQSWIKVLEKDPQELFDAIKDASGIANYLMEKGEFQQERNVTEEKRQIRHIEAENIDQEKFDFYAKDPVDLRFVGCTFRNVTVSESEARLSQFKDCKFYGCDTRNVQDRSVFTHAAFFPADTTVRQPKRRESKYIPADMIELARSQDVFDILQRTGEPLFQKDGQWRSVEHDSLVVTPGKGYYWFSRAEGSKSPIDYFVNVHGMGFQEAARTVLEAIHRDVTYTAPVWQPPAGHEELHPLPRAKTYLDA